MIKVIRDFLLILSINFNTFMLGFVTTPNLIQYKFIFYFF
jgi:hypothetical protein